MRCFMTKIFQIKENFAYFVNVYKWPCCKKKQSDATG